MTIQEYLDERGVPRKSIGYIYLHDMIAECIRSPTMPYHWIDISKNTLQIKI